MLAGGVPSMFGALLGSPGFSSVDCVNVSICQADANTRRGLGMKFVFLAAIGGSLLLMAAPGHAQTPAVTATCNDGTAWSGAHRSGACRGHKGVKAFGTAANPAQPATATPPTPSALPPSRPAPAAAASATGGGAGQVWVNSNSKVYHCQGDRDYGHTKQGSYMTEAAAKAEGDRPSRGKTCS